MPVLANLTVLSLLVLLLTVEVLPVEAVVVPALAVLAVAPVVPAPLMLPVDAVVVAGAERLTCFGFYIRVTALVIAMLGFAGAHGFDNGLIAVLIQADKNVRR